MRPDHLSHPPALSRDQVREVDRRAIQDFGIPGCVLMENAGRSTAEWLVSLGIEGSVIILAGCGNNGGDGFVIARHLDSWGYETHTLLLGSVQKLKGDAELNWNIIRKAGLHCIELGTEPDLKLLERYICQADWTIDALLGTGAQGEIKTPYSDVIECANHNAKQILAIDIPSGLNCDTGEIASSCIKASHTATYIAPKLAFDLSSSIESAGQIQVIDIGIPRTVLEEFLN